MPPKFRGYISIDVDTNVEVRVSEIIEKISDDNILDEGISRGLFKQKPIDISRETISDFFGKSRFTPVPELLKLIQEKLESE